MALTRHRRCGREWQANSGTEPCPWCRAEAAEAKCREQGKQVVALSTWYESEKAKSDRLGHKLQRVGLHLAETRRKLLEVEQQNREKQGRVQQLEANADSNGRWETGLRNIVTRTLGPRAAFDIPQIVDMVEHLWWLREVAQFREACMFGGPWADDASDELDAIWKAALAAREAK